MDPWATIVIPTRDSAAWIDTLLEHYRARGVTPTLLLDSRTRDDTGAIARRRGVPIVDVAPYSFTEQIVRMTRDVVTTPWALFVHDDEIPSDHLFARLQGPQPPAAVQSVAIHRRWAWYEPGKTLCYGRTKHWADRAGQNGYDHTWRLFRPNQVTYIGTMHTEGFLIDRWSRMPPEAYLIHFEWVIRTREQRAAKLRRYDRHRYGYGSYFTRMYLPEDQPPGVIEYVPLGVNTYDVLARTYFAARGPNPPFEPWTLRERYVRFRFKAVRRLGLVRPGRESKERVGLKPRRDAEIRDPVALPSFARSILEPARGLPYDPSVVRALWSIAASPRPNDPICAALLELAESEFDDRHFAASAAVARLALSRAPDEPGPQRMLTAAGAWLQGEDKPPVDQRSIFHSVMAKAYKILGDSRAADAEIQLAHTWSEELTEIHLRQSKSRLPGEGYMACLARFHAVLLPRTYLEIGLFKGNSFALARPPTRAIGIDPNPIIQRSFEAESKIYCETSDAFFQQIRLAPWLNGQALDFAFIDGLHRFEQALKDFLHVEAFCSPNSVIVLHDTIPLDELTQRRDQVTKFYSGDVWKVVLCLKHFRPELDIFTVATPPTGLTVVTGLNPASHILTENYDAAVTRFIDMPYSEIANDLHNALNIVPNVWPKVELRLKARGLVRSR